MAKRRRLTPADPARLEGAPSSETNMRFPTYPDGVARTRSVPIADVAGDAALIAAFEEVTQTLNDARAQGRMVQDLPLDAVDAAYLVRDRVVVDDAEMETLKQSLRARGQQTPIEVTDLGQGRFGLISGWRRLTALRDLAQEDARFDSVLALARRPAEASDAYLAMVEENEIRVGLSYFERARIIARAVEQGVYPTHKAALLSLYHAASRAKRSKIRSFLAVVEALDGQLIFPGALGERLGLALSKALETEPAMTARLRSALDKADAETAEAEQQVIQAALKRRRTPKDRAAEPKAADVQVVPGEDGQLILSGAGVTPELRKALIAWLRDWNAR